MTGKAEATGGAEAAGGAETAEETAVFRCFLQVKPPP